MNFFSQMQGRFIFCKKLFSWVNHFKQTQARIFFHRKCVKLFLCGINLHSASYLQAPENFPANSFPIKNTRNTSFMFNQYFDIYSLKLAFSSQQGDFFNKLIAFWQSFTVSAQAIYCNRANIFKQFSEHQLAIFFNHRSQACLR